ncbi:MAG: hypothetical protein IJW00_08875, partial [Clostridia bacterium]|nr:hypothetical protein [Clostridia bacterium]
RFGSFYFLEYAFRRETERSFSRNFEIFALAFACTSISCCSIFNDQFFSAALALARTALVLYHNLPALSRGFSKVF